MHHPGPCAAAASHLSQGGLQPDAGLLAKGALHEAKHQGDPLHAPEPGKGLACLPGHTGLRQRPPRMYLLLSSFALCFLRECVRSFASSGFRLAARQEIRVLCACRRTLRAILCTIRGCKCDCKCCRPRPHYIKKKEALNFQCFPFPASLPFHPI